MNELIMFDDDLITTAYVIATAYTLADLVISLTE